MNKFLKYKCKTKEEFDQILLSLKDDKLIQNIKQRVEKYLGENKTFEKAVQMAFLGIVFESNEEKPSKFLHSS